MDLLYRCHPCLSLYCSTSYRCPHLTVLGTVLADVDAQPVELRPTATYPALQFFEGVDMSGMAMRAGLRPGDFLLEINGVDVRAASHEQVVELIRQSGDTITVSD